MHAAPKYYAQYATPLRVAVVEDNATARSNLRSHLMGIDYFEVASYSNGNELKNGLRLHNFDIVIMDFHLGQTKNGVEWIQALIERDLFKPSTGLIFITSDSLPQTIGQILDLHPDFIIIKPYTIRKLSLNLEHYLKLRAHVLPTLQYIEQGNNAQALKLINEKINTNTEKRFANDLIKLKGRILLDEKQYAQAKLLYTAVLKKSSGVLWAHWGLIKCEFFTGQWDKCQNVLHNLVSASLTKDKAYEWLASMAIGKEDFNEAEIMLNNIKESDLTVQTTRLKVLALNKQNKHEQAQSLLEKKIRNNLSVKDRMSEYAMELARFHIQLAEALVDTQCEVDDEHRAANETMKQLNLSAARKLIGKAGRTADDRHSALQKDYMLALAYLVEGDDERAKKIVEKSSSLNQMQKIQTSTMIDAVKVLFGIGEIDKAKALLHDCDEHLLSQNNHIEQLVCADSVHAIEQTHHLQKDRALQKNERGNALFIAKEYSQALSCFYAAYKMFPGIPAFSLNLLQCMAQIEQFEYRGLHAHSIYHELENISLSPKNLNRLKHIKIKLAPS